MDDELFPLVDECGNIVGSATRKECHSGRMLLHPTVHLHVIDRGGRILLQKRSKNKDIQPGRWDTAVGGHVDLGENVLTALKREAKEELGLDVENPEYVESYVFQSSVERELINTFFLRVDEPERLRLTPDPSEIDEIKFWEIDEINSQKSSGIFTENFVMEFDRIYPKIRGGVK